MYVYRFSAVCWWSLRVRLSTRFKELFSPKQLIWFLLLNLLRLIFPRIREQLLQASTWSGPNSTIRHAYARTKLSDWLSLRTYRKRCVYPCTITPWKLQFIFSTFAAVRAVVSFLHCLFVFGAFNAIRNLEKSCPQWFMDLQLLCSERFKSKSLEK